MKSKPIHIAARGALIAIAAMLVAWILPWTISFLSSKAAEQKFVMYSCIIDDFAILNTSAADRYTDAQGNSYTAKQFDELLPTFFVHQLVSDGRMPDSINGTPIDPKALQMQNFTFRHSPSDINKPTVGLHMLMESMSGRVELKMPDDVFRFTPSGIEFIDMQSNAVDAAKSQAFSKVLNQKGFAYPAGIVCGNPTNRKDYDNGYMITDANHRLYNLRMVQGRPYVRHIDMPEGCVPSAIFTTEYKNRRWLAFVIDTEQRFWVLNADYSFAQVQLPPIDPHTTAISILGNQFNWTVRLQRNGTIGYYAVDSNTFRPLKNLDNTLPEASWARWLAPIQMRLTSGNDKYVKPRITTVKP